MSEPAPRKGLALHWQILIGLAVGAVGGLVANATGDLSPDGGLARFIRNVADPVGRIFLRLILMVVLPLVFSALVLGIVGLGDVRKLGRLGARTLAFTLGLSAVSVVLGLVLVNVVRPGERMSEENRRKLVEQTRAGKPPDAVEQARSAKPLRDVLIDVVPENPLVEMVRYLDPRNPGGGMIAVMFFALLFGIAMTVKPDRSAGLVSTLEGVYDVSLVIIGWAMKVAPLGVAALVFSKVALLGSDLLKTLALYMATVIAGLAIHTLGVYSLVVSTLGRRSPREFFARAGEAMLTAFGTSSSNATLPVSIRVAEEKLKLRPQVSRFVLTVGSTANQNGTALYEGITVLFLAQVFGVDLSLGQQVTVLLMAIMAGVGTAGVPGGSAPLVVSVLIAVRVPPEAIAIILGVDRLLDMCRTVVNVTGDLVVAACVDRSADEPSPSSA
jgi:dicarboxylate/amino acid:cation (Na+ or H+) symporter, DAACS family